MMESPEWYYEENLKGKTSAQIREIIGNLKREICDLKKVVADPMAHPQEWMICPDPEVQLAMCRLYLQQAEKALAEVGSRE